MPRTKELKPPQEVIDAIQNSEDFTAPESAEAASDFDINVPRTIRNKIVHEEFQPPSEEQLELEAERRGDAGLGDDDERKAHTLEIRKAQESAIRVERDHLTAGTEGHGPAGVINSSMSKGEWTKLGGPTAKGPHHKDRNATKSNQ